MDSDIGDEGALDGHEHAAVLKVRKTDPSRHVVGKEGVGLALDLAIHGYAGHEGVDAGADPEANATEACGQEVVIVADVKSSAVALVQVWDAVVIVVRNGRRRQEQTVFKLA